MAEFDELLQYFEKEKAQFGYSYINQAPHGGFFDVIWEFPIKDHSHGAFGQSEAKQLENSPAVGLRWDWRDVGHFFERQGPLLTCAYVVLNYSQAFHLDEEDLFRLRDEHNPWLYVNRDNLREIEKHHAVNQNVIKGLREGTSRGKQIWEAFLAGCSILAIDPYPADD
jgi:hypothetical protein